MARQGRLRARATVLVDRAGATRTSRYSDMQVVYPQPVAERHVDREAWAHEIARLIEVEAGGNKSLFARRVGLTNTRSLDRWLRREVNVSEDHVRQVARALSLPVGEMLVKVGLMTADELLGQAADSRDEDDAAIRAVRESDAPPSLKRELIAYLRQRRAEQERERREEIERLLDIARRAAGGRSG